MDHFPEDHFVVFVRDDSAHPHRPDASEWPVVTCAGHADARRVRRRLRAQALDCVIRFVGAAGGGD